MSMHLKVQILPEFGCLIEEGYTNTMRKKQGYLGMVYMKKEKDVIDAKYIINTDAKMKAFTDWWVSDLNYGAYPFEVDTLFMGYTGKLVCVMDNDLIVNYIDGLWNITMKLNVLYIIDTP